MRSDFSSPLIGLLGVQLAQSLADMLTVIISGILLWRFFEKRKAEEESHALSESVEQ